MDMTDKLAADQIIERIANANGVAPDTMRTQSGRSRNTLGRARYRYYGSRVGIPGGTADSE